MVRRYISPRLLLTSLIAAAAIAVMSGKAEASVKNPDAFVYAHMGEITSLDPVYPYDAVSQGIIFNVYETLIRFKGTSLKDFEPCLSEKVPSVANGLISKDGLTYRFPMRKGVKFHDGAEMTADDAAYSLMRFMLTDPAGGPASLLLEPILGLSSTRDQKGQLTVSFDDVRRAIRTEGNTLVITLKTPFAPFLSIMARWSYVMERKWCAAHGEWDGSAETWKKFNNGQYDKSAMFERMNGTGPFMLERWDRNRKRISLVRFDKYHDKPAALQRVVAMSVSEFATRRLMLETGDADLIDVPRAFEPQVTGMKNVVIADNLPRLKVDPVFFFTFSINAAGNPDVGSGQLDGNGIPQNFFSDPDIRKGFAYAFDYDAYLKQSMRGKATRAIGPIPPGLPGYNSKLPRYNYSPDKAREHFKKAWGGKVWDKGFKFTMTYNTGGDMRQLACEMMKKNVEALNPKFKVQLRGIDWPSFLDKAQRRQMPVFSRGWIGDYPDPHNFTFPFFASEGRYPTAQGYRNPEFDKIIDTAVRTIDPAKRQKLYDQIVKMGYDEVVQIYTVHPEELYAYRDWIHGFYDNAVFMGIYYYPIKKY